MNIYDTFEKILQGLRLKRAIVYNKKQKSLALQADNLILLNVI